MGSYMFFGFLEILRESIKLLSKNRKVLLFIFTLTFLLNSLSLLLLFSITTSIISGDIVKQTTPQSIPNPNEFKFVNPAFVMIKDMGIILATQLLFSFSSVIIVFFEAISTIFTSASSYQKEDLSIKELLRWVAKSWFRPLVTMFYIQLLSLGFVGVLFVPIFISIAMIFDHPFAAKLALIVIGSLSAISLCYFSVVWTLALVISVNEKSCYGIEALGKSGKIVKGKRLDGFMLNMFSISLSAGMGCVFWIVKDSKSPWKIIVMTVCMILVGVLASMFQYMAYTVLYFQCKMNYAEETLLQGNLEYTKIPSTVPLDHEDLP